MVATLHCVVGVGYKWTHNFLSPSESWWLSSPLDSCATCVRDRGGDGHRLLVNLSSGGRCICGTHQNVFSKSIVSLKGRTTLLEGGLPLKSLQIDHWPPRLVWEDKFKFYCKSIMELQIN